MKRRIAAVFVIIFFIFTSTAYAFDNSSYYSDIKIGLENMTSNQIKVTLNGSYSCLGSTIPSGTTFSLGISGNTLSYNGKTYSELDFVPVNSENTIKLQSGTKVYSYLGNMDFKINSGKILPVNELPIEDYLKGVIGYEMSNSYPIEALKAQAVAARNYALANMDKHRSEGYDLCDTIDCQVYRGYNPSYKNVEEAVDETKGQVLLYGNQLITAYYASSDGGYTENSGNVWPAQLPYLIAKPDTYDTNSWPNGNLTFTSKQIEQTLKTKKYLASTDTFNKINLDTIAKYESGRISNIDVDYTDASGTSHVLSFSKESARTFLGLPSAMYDVFYDTVSDTYTFMGKGYGHGVGMSQVGAKSRANAGQTYDAILSFYYDGTFLNQILSKINTFTSDKSNILTGDKILFSTSCDNQSNLLFKFTVEKDGNVLYTRDYMNNASFEYSPASAGNYKAHVYMKTLSSQNDYDDTASLGFTVYSSPVITSITQSPDLHVKRPVDISVNTTGGSPNSEQYKFEVLYNGTSFSKCDYQNESTYEFTPDKEGSYTVRAYVKDNLSAKDYDSTKEIAVNITSDTSRGSTGTLAINVPVKKGMKNSSVNVLQNCLVKLGYNIGTVDGIFGSKTLSAVVSFQKSKGLTPNGIVDAKTLSALNNEIQKKTGTVSNPVIPPPAVIQNPLNISRILKTGMKGSDVKTVQQVLNKLGYSVGTADGVYGGKTYNAVKTYQTKNKIPVTGTIESKTLASLSANYSVYLNSTASRGTSAISFSISRVLKMGTSGTDVKSLQQALKHLSYTVNITGVFDSQTYNAVRSFQKLNHLTADGIVGTNTAKLINAKLN